jgi:signal transduction histidine kinase
MTRNFFLDWSIISCSLFNTILLLWLGLTVLFNSDRRRWGIWVAGAGLILGGVFFACHTSIVSNTFNPVGREINSIWYYSWILLVILPFSWYILILWHLGFWDKQESYLKKRQKYWLIFLVLLLLLVGPLVLFTNTLPTFLEFAKLDLSESLSIRNVPILIIIYPIYILFCIILALDALRFPGPSRRIMGDIARRRARPWLMSASIMLLLVSLLVTVFMLWLLFNSGKYEKFDTFYNLYPVIGTFDFIIEAFVSLAIIFLGQAITSYEIFTGKTLPRRGLFRSWLNIIFIAAGYGIIVGSGLVSRFSTVYYLLFTTFLMTIFYALSNWRFYSERERYIDNLRPFVGSQKLYEHLLVDTDSVLPVVDVQTPFYALCRDLLEAESAYLMALGPLAPLVGSVLSYPEKPGVEFPLLNEITEKIVSPEIICVPVEPEKNNGVILAVPLWSERGLIGLLLLGRKLDDGFYTQEEIEIARASGERLIDTKASSEMAGWLMDFQRKRLTESQVLDRRARRTLHDDILPLLHTAMLNLNANDTAVEAVNLIGDAHHKISDLLHEMPSTSVTEISKLGLIESLKKFVKNEMNQQFDNINWEIDVKAQYETKNIPALVNEVIFYASREAIRNAARYGRNTEAERQLNLNVSIKWQDGLEIIIEDDGAGFKKGGESKGGSGHGLSLHSTMMAVIGGSLSIESAPDKYTRVTLFSPFTFH